MEKIKMLLILLSIALTASSATSQSILPQPGSIEMLSDIGNLPMIYQDVKDGMFSSTDPNQRGNDHGNYLRTDGDEYILCEMEGPGVITRIWSANAHARIRIYIDDKEKPVVDCMFKDIFEDRYPPFKSPISGKSSGGWYSYYPIGYKEYCRIAVTQDSEITESHEKESKSRDVSVSVKGAKELKLIVTDAGDGRDADRANWANARLTKSDGSEFFLSEITEKTEDIKLVSAKQDTGKLGINRNVLNNPIRMKGEVFEKGLGTNANSEIVYHLNGEFEKFEAITGLDDASQIHKKGTIIFKVEVDGKEAFNSDLVGYRQFEGTFYPPTLYYHINFRSFPKGTEIIPFKTELTEAEQKKFEKILNLWTNKGICPIERQATDRVEKRIVKVERGKTIELSKLQGAGYIYSLKMKLKSDDPRAYRKTIIKMYWDGESKPSVWAPYGDFFGSGFGHVEFNSLPFGMGKDSIKGMTVKRPVAKSEQTEEIIGADECYSYWVMPFAKGARIEIENGSKLPIEISMEALWRPAGSMPENAGRFCTQYREEIGIKGKLVDLLHAKGTGKFVGVLMNVQGIGDIAYLEGNEQYFIDGEEKPSMIGTGTEDFFNGGWYYDKGVFDCPLHGLTEKERTLFGRTSQYRLQIPDSVTFRKSFDLIIEHGTNNIHLDDRYSSLAYYYLIPPTVQQYEPPKASDMNFPRQLLVRPNLPGKGAKGDEKARVIPFQGAKFADEIFDAVSASCNYGLAFWKDISEGYEGTNMSLFLWWPSAYLIADEKQDPRLKEPYRGDVIICSASKRGDYLELPPAEGVETAERWVARYWLVGGPDYGIVKISIGDENIGEQVDLYSPEVKPVELGPFFIADGGGKTRIEVIGKNPLSQGVKAGFYAYKVVPALIEATVWSVIGPFRFDTKSIEESYNAKLPPETELHFNKVYPGKIGDVSWKEMPLTMVQGDDYQAVDFTRGIPSSGGSIAYALTFIESDAEVEAILKLGHSRSFSVLLNDEKVYEKIITRPFKIDEESANVRLKKGINKLLIKTGNPQGIWKFSIRILNKDGSRIESLKYLRKLSDVN